MHRRTMTAPRSLAIAAALVALLARGAVADPTLGFLETWSGGNLAGWGGGAGGGCALSNPGTGGVNGASDGYFLMTTAAPGNLGSYSGVPAYTGNFQAAGVTHVKLWLQQFSGPAASMHLSIGNQSNLWQYNTGFTPPVGSWGSFIVDLSSAANFTQIIGEGNASATFAAALQNVSNFHIRHDLAPYVKTPDQIQASVGLDSVLLGDASSPVSPTTWGRIKALYK